MNCIGSFNFWIILNADHPAFIKEKKFEKKISLGLTTSRTYLFTRYFGLIFGHKVPIKDQYWELYTMLCNLLIIIDKRWFTSVILANLKQTISRLLSLYTTLFNDTLEKLKSI